MPKSYTLFSTNKVLCLNKYKKKIYIYIVKLYEMKKLSEAQCKR